MAFGTGSSNGNKGDTSNLLHDFEYKPLENTFKYPTCSLTSDFALPGSNETALADYTYLAGIAYNSPESMKDLLEAWFGPDVAQDNDDLVQQYREGLETDSAVHYKLITFPKLDPDFAIVDIRGTNNGWDMISDAQLWSAAWLAQAVRAILPLGAIWSPIIDNVVEWIGVLQTATLREVAFYVQTAGFVNYLKDQNLYKNLRVTGHSLGVSMRATDKSGAIYPNILTTPCCSSSSQGRTCDDYRSPDRDPCSCAIRSQHNHYSQHFGTKGIY